MTVKLIYSSFPFTCKIREQFYNLIYYNYKLTGSLDICRYTNKLNWSVGIISYKYYIGHRIMYGLCFLLIGMHKHPEEVVLDSTEAQSELGVWRGGPIKTCNQAGPHQPFYLLLFHIINFKPIFRDQFFDNPVVFTHRTIYGCPRSSMEHCQELPISIPVPWKSDVGWTGPIMPVEAPRRPWEVVPRVQNHWSGPKY